MTVEQIVLLMGGIGTLIGTTVLALRGLRSDGVNLGIKKSENILSGYSTQVKDMRLELTEARRAHQEELTAVRKAHAEEMFRLNTQHRAEIDRTHELHDQDREEWAQEKAELRSEIEMLKAQLVALLARIDNTPLPRRKDP